MSSSIRNSCTRAALLAAVVLSTPGAAFAQGALEDYQRADSLGSRFRGLLHNTRIEARWFEDGSGLWYRRQLPEGRSEFVIVRAEKGERALAFDHGKLAAALSKAHGSKIESDRLPIERIAPAGDGALLIRASGKSWKCSLDSYELTKHDGEIPEGKRGKKLDRSRRQRWSGRRRGHRSDRSPDKKWQTFERDRNLWIRGIEDNKAPEKLVAEAGEEHKYEGSVFWSPDSKHFVALRRKEAEPHIVYMIESSPKDQLQPKLHQHRYYKPGDDMPFTKPKLFRLTPDSAEAPAKEIKVDDELYDHPWDIRHYRWEPDSSRITFTYNARGHQALRIVSIEAKTGEASALVDETSEAFIDYAHKQFYYFLEDRNELIWMSERDGWNHLYLFDWKTGEVKNQITKGDWVVRAVDRIDPEKRQIWFRAGGIYPNQDPYYIHYARVNFDGSGLVVLTAGDGTHSAEASPDGKYIVDNYSRVDMPAVTELRRVSDGKLLCELERPSLAKLLAKGWIVPERFVSKARDGKTDIYGVIYRPTNLDPSKKYPIIEKIYAGPHGSFVPKSFREVHGGQVMAEIGFVVVQIDGMGTSNRSKAFQNVAAKNIGDSGFPDRKIWIREAAKKYPYMDLSRVGIYGGSAGGQSTLRALTAHPDFYHVGCADCGCHDNRMDKVWWNELWMGYPVGDHYAEQSNVVNAHKLEGKVLLIVGELDRNVDPASTMQVVDALIKADKDFDLLVVPGGGHGVGGSRYGRRRQRDFFVRHLLGVEPRR